MELATILYFFTELFVGEAFLNFGLEFSLMEVSLSEIKEKEYFDSEKVDQSTIIVVPGEVITTEQGFLK